MIALYHKYGGYRILFLLIVAFIRTVPLSAQSSENYIINKSVIDQGGKPSSSENYIVHDAVGQPSPSGITASSHYGVSAGFFGGSRVETGMDEESASTLPDEFCLEQNYPNPFNPVTTIKFDTKEKCHVSLNVYNLQGRQIASITNRVYQPGSYEFSFNGGDFPSGIYLYRLEAGGYVETRKMILAE